MNDCLRCCAVSVFGLGLCAAGQQPAFHAEVNLVNITAVVRSSDGKLLKNLTKDDFELLEDGVPQRIQFFAREAETPLNLGLILDASGSQDKFLKRHDRDVETFLKTVLRPQDRAFGVCFGSRLRLVSDESSDAGAIMDGFASFEKGSRKFPQIGPEAEREGGTALFDAIYFSIMEKMKSAGERRRALIVFSDGEENASEHDQLDAIEGAEDTDTLVYSIRYTETKHGHMNATNKYGMRVLDHISMLTGAASFDGLASNLETVFTQIGDELRAMYEIGYVSSNEQVHDGSFRKVTVRCKEPATVVRTKSGYYAR